MPKAKKKVLRAKKKILIARKTKKKMVKAKEFIY